MLTISARNPDPKQAVDGTLQPKPIILHISASKGLAGSRQGLVKGRSKHFHRFGCSSGPHNVRQEENLT